MVADLPVVLPRLGIIFDCAGKKSEGSFNFCRSGLIFCQPVPMLKLLVQRQGFGKKLFGVKIVVPVHVLDRFRPQFLRFYSRIFVVLSDITTAEQQQHGGEKERNNLSKGVVFQLFNFLRVNVFSADITNK